MEASHNGDETKTHIIYDTSFLVNYGQQDLGAMLAMLNVKRRLPNGYVEVVPRLVNEEYMHLFGNKTSNQYGVPKASVNVMRAIHNETAAVRNIDENQSVALISEARETWAKSSRKALLGKSISTTDLGIIAYSEMLDDTGCESFVFSLDDDILAPVSKLERSGRRTHAISYTKDENVSIVCEPATRLLLLTEGVMKELYNVQPTNRAYMKMSKIEVGDIKADVVFEFDDDSPSRKLDGTLRKVPTSIIDLQDIPDIRERHYLPPRDARELMRKEDYRQLNVMLNLCERMYRECEYFVVMRNKNMGTLDMIFYRLGRGNRLRSAASNSIQWYFLPDNYLAGFHLDWSIALSARIKMSER